MSAITHRIDLEPAGNGKGRMIYNGEDIGVSNCPLFAAARVLQARGAADGDRIETWRGGMLCLYSTIGAASGLTVSEPDKGGGPTITKFKPFSRSWVDALESEPDATTQLERV